MTARWWYVQMLLFSAMISNDNFDRQIYEETRHTILYDEHQNPVKIVVESWQVQIPVVDGIPYHDQADIYYLKQEFSAHEPASARQTTKPVFQVIKPKIVCNTYAPTQVLHVLQRPDLPKESGPYFHIKPAQHWPTSFEMLSQQEFTALYLKLLNLERIYWHYFHTSPDGVDALLKLSFNNFERKLLSLDIVDEAVFYLLRRYLKKRKWNYSGEKQELEQHVLEALEKRNIKKQREAQKVLQQKLQEERKLAEQELLEEKKRKQAYQKVQEEKRIRYEHESINDWDYCDSLPQDLYDARERALEQTKAEQYASHEKQYDLPAQTLGYLVSENMDMHAYGHFFGTALQHQLHQETCNVFDQVALQTMEHKQPVCFTKQAFLFAQAVYETNKKDWIAVAGAMSDIAQQLAFVAQDMYENPYEYIQVLAQYCDAIGQAVDETILEAMDILAYPDIAMHNLVHLGATIGYAFYRVLDLAATAHVAHIFDDNALAQEAYEKEAQRMKQDLANLQKNIAQQMATMDGPDRVKCITKIGANFFMPPIVSQAFGMHFKGAAASGALGIAESLVIDVGHDAISQIKDLQAVGVASVLAEEEIAAHALSEFAKATATTKKLIPSKPKGASSPKKFKPARRQTRKSEQKKNLPAPLISDICLKQTIAEVTALKEGIIPYTNVILKDRLEAGLKTILEEWNNLSLHSENLNNLMKDLMYESYFNELGQKINVNVINMKHVIHFEYEFVELAQGWQVRFSGGHASGICEFLKRKGLITIIHKEKLPNGCIEYECKEALTGFEFTKTEFPESWSWRKIIESGHEVFRKGIECEGKDNKLIRALCVDGVDISIKIKHHKQGSNIENILPYIETEIKEKIKKGNR